jgi:hypothetical protein
MREELYSRLNTAQDQKNFFYHVVNVTSPRNTSHPVTMRFIIHHLGDLLLGYFEYNEPFYLATRPLCRLDLGSRSQVLLFHGRSRSANPLVFICFASAR